MIRSLCFVVFATVLLGACGSDENGAATELVGVATLTRDSTIEPGAEGLAWEVRSDRVVAVGLVTGACAGDPEALLPASVVANYSASTIVLTITNRNCTDRDSDSVGVDAGIAVELIEAIGDRSVEVVIER